MGRWNTKFGQPYTATELQEVVTGIIPEAARPLKWLRDGVNPTHIDWFPRKEARNGLAHPVKTIDINDPNVVCRGCCQEYYVNPTLFISII